MKDFSKTNQELKVNFARLIDKYNSLEEEKRSIEKYTKDFNEKVCNWLEEEFERNGKVKWTVFRDYDSSDTYFRLSFTTHNDTIWDSIYLTEEQMDKEHLTAEDLITQNESESLNQINKEKDERYNLYLKLKAEFEK